LKGISKMSNYNKKDEETFYFKNEVDFAMMMLTPVIILYLVVAIIFPANNDKAKVNQRSPSSQTSALCSTGTLVASEPDAEINIRSGAGLEYSAEHYGLPNDVVNLLANQNDKEGAVWYQIEFPSSKAQGWLKSDFVKVNCQ
jgi:hypothetical protein